MYNTDFKEINNFTLTVLTVVGLFCIIAGGALVIMEHLDELKAYENI